jgi:hypothetical protein
MSPNWLIEFERAVNPGWRLFFIFVTRQAGAFISRALWGLALGRPLRGALRTARFKATGLGVPGAGAPPPGSPPPDGHQWVPAPWFPPHTSRGGWGSGCGGGVGAAFWCPKWPVPLSRLFGGGLESHRNPLKSGNPLERHRGGAGLVTATYRPSVREDIRANALDPPRTQNPVLIGEKVAAPERLRTFHRFYTSNRIAGVNGK